MEAQINQALETAKEYTNAAVHKATELAEEVVSSAKEMFSDLQGDKEGLTRKPSAPLSPSEEKKLDEALANRPRYVIHRLHTDLMGSAKELQEKNILKDTKVAPS